MCILEGVEVAVAVMVARVIGARVICYGVLIAGQGRAEVVVASKSSKAAVVVSIASTVATESSSIASVPVRHVATVSKRRAYHVAIFSLVDVEICNP